MDKIIDVSEIENQTKGKIGELLCRDYYRKEYVVWDLNEGGSSGTGKDYFNIKNVLTPEEYSFLLGSLGKRKSSTFDFLLIPKRQLEDKRKKQLKQISGKLSYCVSNAKEIIRRIKERWDEATKSVNASGVIIDGQFQ